MYFIVRKCRRQCSYTFEIRNKYVYSNDKPLYYDSFNYPQEQIVKIYKMAKLLISPCMKRVQDMYEN